MLEAIFFSCLSLFFHNSPVTLTVMLPWFICTTGKAKSLQAKGWMLYLCEPDFFKQFHFLPYKTSLCLKKKKKIFCPKLLPGIVHDGNCENCQYSSERKVFAFPVPKISQAPLHCPPIYPLTVHSSALGSSSQAWSCPKCVQKRSRCAAQSLCESTNVGDFCISSACPLLSPLKNCPTFDQRVQIPFYTNIPIFVNK